MMEVGLRAYALTGKSWNGFVLGGSLFVHEDDAEFNAPSALTTTWQDAERSRPTLLEVEAAARVLERAGTRHRWWNPSSKSYDEMAASDTIAKSEFDGLVEQMLIAACEARMRSNGLSGDDGSSA